MFVKDFILVHFDSFLFSLKVNLVILIYEYFMISSNKFHLSTNFFGEFYSINDDIPLINELPYFLTKPFSDDLLLDPFGGSIEIRRFFLQNSSDSDLILFEVQINAHLSLKLAVLSTISHPSNCLLRTLIGSRSRFQKFNYYRINYLLDLPERFTLASDSLKRNYCSFTLVEALDQVDYLIALVLQDLFTSLDLENDLPFNHIKNFLHEYYYEGHVDHFLKEFYDYYLPSKDAPLINLADDFTH